MISCKLLLCLRSQKPHIIPHSNFELTTTMIFWGNGREELLHAPTPEARGCGREEQPMPEARGREERSYPEPWLRRCRRA